VLLRNNVRAFAASGLIGLLSACGSPNPAATAPVASENSSVMATVQKVSAKTVLLATDVGTNEAYILAYPSGKLLHTLTGLSEPQGACSDGNGHFWIANTGESNIVEFSSDGANLGSLSDPSNFPAGCAFDPKTGDLAVTNILTTSDGPGSIAIYAKAKGSPTLYTTQSMSRMLSAAYDGSSGTLVVAGENSSSAFAMSSLKNGKFKAITLKGVTVGFAGSLAWSPKIRSMNVGDQEASVIYHFELNGKVTGTTSAPSAYVLFNGTLLSAISEGIEVYAYPAGGSPKKLIPFQFSEADGLAVSSAVTE
jgi:hypothetical protein